MKYVSLPLSLLVTACWILITVICGCSRQTDIVHSDCQIDDGPCVKMIMPDDITAVFDIQPKPVRTMSSLIFSVSLLKGEVPLADSEVFLYLTMPGMRMGENRTKLSHMGKGMYKGAGTIVRCPSGKRLWKAEIVINENRLHPPRTVSAEYLFEVRKQ